MSESSSELQCVLSCLDEIHGRNESRTRGSQRRSLCLLCDQMKCSYTSLVPQPRVVTLHGSVQLQGRVGSLVWTSGPRSSRWKLPHVKNVWLAGRAVTISDFNYIIILAKGIHKKQDYCYIYRNNNEINYPQNVSVGRWRESVTITREKEAGWTRKQRNTRPNIVPNYRMILLYMCFFNTISTVTFLMSWLWWHFDYPSNKLPEPSTACAIETLSLSNEMGHNLRI